MTSKDLFLQDREACKEHNAAINAQWFRKAMAFAKAEMFEQETVSAEMLKGARMLETLFMGLSEVPGEPITFNSGLQHDVDNPLPQKPESK